MVRSMTAYGRAQVETEEGFFLVEIQSVNRKGLEIHMHLPKECLVLDLDIRDRLKKTLQRGMITLRLSKEVTHSLCVEMPSLTSVKKMHDHLRKCAVELGYDFQKVVPFSALVPFLLTGVSSPPPFSINDSLKIHLFEGVDKALDALVKMKQKEGAALIAALVPLLNRMKKGVETIKRCADRAPQTFQNRLNLRLESLDFAHQIDPERLLREVVLFADKVDVSEEIIRLLSHIQQFEGFLHGDQFQIGRELGFLIQEMSREVNTIGAKSQDLEIVQTVLMVKLELEKVREQVANIE